MVIRILPGESRRFAWTDRKSGYLLLSGRQKSSGCGYFRGDRRFVDDFFVSPDRSCPLADFFSSDLYRSNALHTDVMPEGMSSVFDIDSQKIIFDISLLLDEEAFYIRLCSGPSTCAGAGIILENVFLSDSANPDVLPIDVRASCWTRYESDGVIVWEDGNGTAVSSDIPFRLECGEEEKIILFSDAHDASWYLVFETDRETARTKAIRLAASRSISAHRAAIASFFEGSQLSSGDSRFDDAVRWALFSGWMLVSDKNGRGIRSGLPGPGENRSRDICISLSGILLASGRFSEAREILVTLARSQNKNPESSCYGRIPDCRRDDGLVTWNSADANLWFIRSLWEYVQYTGDLAILEEVTESAELAIESDIERHTDSSGFLLHGATDTWMFAEAKAGTVCDGDAFEEKKHVGIFSARADRACEIQALWFTALRIGVRLALLRGDSAAAVKRELLSKKLKESFRRIFWSDDYHALADFLPPGPQGEWMRNFRVRPNQLIAITAPLILGSGPQNMHWTDTNGETEADADETALLDAGQRRQIIENVTRELVSPFGLFSLCPDDPFFHPREEKGDWFRSNVASHNGAIWPWVTGQYLSASLAACGKNGCARDLDPIHDALLANIAKMILDTGCAGTLGGMIAAMPAADGTPVQSGDCSRAWSVSEFVRSIFQDITGFRPRLAENRLELCPHLPAGIDSWSAEVVFGPLWRLQITVTRRASVRGKKAPSGKIMSGNSSCSGSASEFSSVLCRLLWKTGMAKKATSDTEGKALTEAGLLTGGDIMPRKSSCATQAESIGNSRDLYCLIDTLETGKYPSLTINGIPVFPEVPLVVIIGPGGTSLAGSLAGETVPVPKIPTGLHIPLAGRFGLRTDTATTGLCNNSWITNGFPQHDFAPDWCGPVNRNDFIETLFANGLPTQGLQDLSNVAALSWFFDSDYFRNTYHTPLPCGALYSSEETLFRLWAPTARSVTLLLYSDGHNSTPWAVIPMRRGSKESGKAGVWESVFYGDLHGTYYCYRVQVHGLVRETPDPCAKAAGVNGKRSMIVNFSLTDPDGWHESRVPVIKSPNDVIVWEMHVADLTSSPYWTGDPALRRGYAGAGLKGTSYEGIPTGFDHIRSLGITHVQLLPVFDFSSVDETRIGDADYRNQLTNGLFNWGYDPANFSVPEGSYSSDPYDGLVRIKELKGLIQSFHAAGIGVIMDVVYNHVPSAGNHPFGICVPGYYFREVNVSGAGDDTASERAMFRAYMIESLCWWLSEYKLSGFRFDLMGLHDVTTMNEIALALRQIRPDVLLYGEGWDMYRGEKMVPASMFEARKLPGIGFFNDAFRCGIKGPIFSPRKGGFIHDGSHIEAVKFGIVGAVYHHQVHNRYVDGTANPNPWTDRTATSVNYTEIHDNMTLYDKLVLVESDKDEAYYERLQKTSISLVLLAQGMPVLHAGMEFLRTKEIPPDILAGDPNLYDIARTEDGKRAFSLNSYNLCDRINALDWKRCAEKKHIVEYVRNLIALRRAHPLFRLGSAEEVVLSVSFVKSSGVSHAQGPSLLVWTIDGCATVDTWQSVCVIVNPSGRSVSFTLPPCCNDGRWHLVTDGESFRKDPPLADTAPRIVRIAAKALYLYAEF